MNDTSPKRDPRRVTEHPVVRRNREIFELEQLLRNERTISEVLALENTRLRKELEMAYANNRTQPLGLSVASPTTVV